MAAPKIFKSTDAGAPVLTGEKGTLVDLLDWCLRTGYGGAYATATITSSGVNVSNNDTVTVGTQTYTFKTALTPAANEVLIGATAAASLLSLARAISLNGNGGTEYAAATTRNADARYTSVTSTVATLSARLPGTDGNSIALSKSAATLTVSGAVFSGGTQGKATAVLTSDNTVPSNNDTVTIGSRTYTFKTVLTGAANEIFIGADADTTLQNLRDAINGTSGNGSGGGAGSEYGTGTAVHADVTSSTVTAHAITLTAILYGPAQNSLASTETSTHLSFGGTTFSGGSGRDPVGTWTKPFTSGTNIAVWKQNAGSGFYLRVDDNATSDATNGVREALIRGWEVKADALDTADVNNTGPFPTSAQVAAFCVRKSALGANTAGDPTQRAWRVIADDRTIYMIMTTGDAAGIWFMWSFGDIYSFYTSADPYKCIIMGHATSFAQNTSQAPGILSNGVTTTQTAHYMARSYTGVGASLAVGKIGDGGKMGACRGGSVLGTAGAVAFPNPADGGIYLSPIYVIETSTGNIRGTLRGFWHQCHAIGNFVDEDTLTANTGKYSGRSFIFYKQSNNYGDGSGNTFPGVFTFETSAWDTSS